MREVEFLCLAYSHKHSGCCVAGFDLAKSEFIRPVSRIEGKPLSFVDCKLEDGSQPKILDVIKISLDLHRPSLHQFENWKVAHAAWKLLLRPSPAGEVEKLLPNLDRGPDIFGSQKAFVMYGDAIGRMTSGSICIIPPGGVRFTWENNTFYQAGPRRQLRCFFKLGSADYQLPVTDLNFEARVERIPAGRPF